VVLPEKLHTEKWNIYRSACLASGYPYHLEVRTIHDNFVSETQSNTTATTNIKDTRRQLFTEHQSKKPKTSGESSKGKQEE
jgi:hypothetical protein